MPRIVGAAGLALLLVGAACSQSAPAGGTGAAQPAGAATSVAAGAVSTTAPKKARPTGTAAPIPATTAARATEAPTQPNAAGEWRRVGGPEVGLTFEVPRDWVQDPGEPVYRPRAGATLAVGVQQWTGDRVAPDDTALLPNHAEITGQMPVDLGWASGTRYMLLQSDPAAAGGAVQSRQSHLVVRPGHTTAYDIFAAAPATEDAQRQVSVAYQHLVQSVVPLGG